MEKKKVLQKIDERFEAAQIAKSLVRLLTKKGRLSLLPKISQFLAEAGREDDRLTIETPNLLKIEDQEKLIILAKKKFPKIKRVDFIVNPELLSGIVFRRGDRVVEMTGRVVLDKLKK